jgi:hypothetical protein
MKPVASWVRKFVQTAWRSKPGIIGIGNGGCDASSQRVLADGDEDTAPRWDFSSRRDSLRRVV